MPYSDVMKCKAAPIGDFEHDINGVQIGLFHVRLHKRVKTSSCWREFAFMFPLHFIFISRWLFTSVTSQHLILHHNPLTPLCIVLSSCFVFTGPLSPFLWSHPGVYTWFYPLVPQTWAQQPMVTGTLRNSPKMEFPNSFQMNVLALEWIRSPLGLFMVIALCVGFISS